MFFCKSENWLDPRDTHWDEASSLTPFPRTAWRAAFLFNRHQHGQPFSWEWVRQGSWWRWSPLRLAPWSRSRDSIGESAQHCGGEEREQPSLIYYTLSSCYTSHRPASYLLNEIQHLFWLISGCWFQCHTFLLNKMHFVALFTFWQTFVRSRSP